MLALSTADAAGETAEGNAATLLSCSISQNADGTCPLTCTGNGGSQFYYCANEGNAIQLDGDASPGDCGNYAYTSLSAFIVSAPIAAQCPRSLEGRSC